MSFAVTASVVGIGAGLTSIAGGISGMTGSGADGMSPAGTTNQTTTQVPWSEQAPYLTQGFQGASDLYKNYKPQYYQGQQVADFTGAQNQALQGIQNYANSGQSPFWSANNYLKTLDSGAYLNANPVSQNLTPIGTGQNLWLNPAFSSTNSGVNQSNSILSNIANNYNGSSGNSYLNPWASGAALNNPGTGYLSNLASGSASAKNPASRDLSYLSSGRSTANLPGQDTLSYFANGSMLGADNPYWKNLTDSLSASVLPGIQAQFAKGNSMSNPAAIFASSQGLASALAPYMEQNYTQGQSNMLNAANTLGSQGLQGLQLRQGAAGTLGSQYLTGQQLAGQAGQNIAQNYLTGANTTAGAAQNLASNQYVGQGQGIQAAQGLGANALNQGTLFNNAYNSGQQNILGANSIIGQNYQNTLNNMTNSLSQAPSIGQMPYNEFQQLFASGAQGQSQQQNQINALMNQWNWQQQLPYNQLNQFMNTVGGAQYGNQSTTSTPYFQNSYANILGSAQGLLGAGKSLYNQLSSPDLTNISYNAPYSGISAPPSSAYTPSTVAGSVPYYTGP